MPFLISSLLKDIISHAGILFNLIFVKIEQMGLLIRLLFGRIRK